MIENRGPFNLSFTNEHIIYENIIKCTVKDSDLKYSFNPSIVDATGSFHNNIDENFLPYATSLGIYNDNNDLLMVAKFATPIPMSRNTDITFLIKYDV